jgi:acyl dehydratase
VSEFDAMREGDELPLASRIVTREDVAAYADAGGDRNPLHVDDAFARSVGFGGIIAHGMFTMGHLAQAVADWAGEDGRVERISVQFRAPVSMGEAITAGGSVAGVDRDRRTATLEVWVTVDRGGAQEFAIRRGRAEIVFAGNRAGA